MERVRVTKVNDWEKDHGIEVGIIGKADFKNTKKTGNVMFYPDNECVYRICMNTNSVERID